MNHAGDRFDFDKNKGKSDSSVFWSITSSYCIHYDYVTSNSNQIIGYSIQRRQQLPGRFVRVSKTIMCCSTFPDCGAGSMSSNLCKVVRPPFTKSSFRLFASLSLSATGRMLKEQGLPNWMHEQWSDWCSFSCDCGAVFMSSNLCKVVSRLLPRVHSSCFPACYWVPQEGTWLAKLNVLYEQWTDWCGFALDCDAGSISSNLCKVVCPPFTKSSFRLFASLSLSATGRNMAC